MIRLINYLKRQNLCDIANSIRIIKIENVLFLLYNFRVEPFHFIEFSLAASDNVRDGPTSNENGNKTEKNVESVPHLFPFFGWKN